VQLESEKMLPERKSKSSAVALEPMLVSIADAAAYTGESLWTVKMRLRDGTYEAVKSGRRTLVVLATVKRYAENLPDAKFAAPRERRRTTVAA
jgi:hypothetical protein